MVRGAQGLMAPGTEGSPRTGSPAAAASWQVSVLTESPWGGGEVYKHNSHSHGDLSLRQVKNRFHVAIGSNNFSGKQLYIYTTLAAFYTAEGWVRAVGFRK